jgi:hypothetical protein
VATFTDRHVLSPRARRSRLSCPQPASSIRVLPLGRGEQGGHWPWRITDCHFSHLQRRNWSRASLPRPSPVRTPGLTARDPPELLARLLPSTAAPGRAVAPVLSPVGTLYSTDGYRLLPEHIPSCCPTRMEATPLHCSSNRPAHEAARCIGAVPAIRGSVPAWVTHSTRANGAPPCESPVPSGPAT